MIFQTIRGCEELFDAYARQPLKKWRPIGLGRQASERLYQGDTSGRGAARIIWETDDDPFSLANLVLHHHDSRASAAAIDEPRTAHSSRSRQRRPNAMALSRPRMPRASRITAAWRDVGSSCNLTLLQRRCCGFQAK